MEKNVLKAVQRDVKSNLRSLREQGLVPAVLYGHGFQPVVMAVESKPFSKLLQTAGKNALITLDLEGKSENALVKDIQRDIIKRNMIHVDFQRVVMSEKIEVSIPIHVVGEAPGVKVSGGLLEHLTRAIKVRCLPTNIPPAIAVDVSSLEIGQSVLVRDLKPLEGVEVLTDPALIVVNVIVPHVEEEAAPAEGAAAPGATAAEPEVIATKGKKEEEGAEGAAAKPGEAKKGAPTAGGDAKKAPAGDAKKGEAAKPEAKKPEAKK
jgi:large subunit ribosomal protein L25